jgi:hypothetical protein
MACCLAALAASAEASCEEAAETAWPQPPRLRLHVDGGLGGYLSYSMRMPDGSRASPSCSSLQLIPAFCRIAPALGLGMDWSPVPLFGLGLRGRWVHAIPGNGSIFGRRLDVVEVLLVPQMSLPWHKRIPRGGARPYLAAPVGLAWSFESRAWERAVQESWNGRAGLSVGAALGFELFWGARWGTLLELDYRARFLSADVVSTSFAEPASPATERVTVTQHQLIFSVGLLFGVNLVEQ